MGEELERRATGGEGLDELFEDGLDVFFNEDSAGGDLAQRCHSGFVLAAHLGENVTFVFQ